MNSSVSAERETMGGGRRGRRKGSVTHLTHLHKSGCGIFVIIGWDSSRLNGTDSNRLTHRYTPLHTATHRYTPGCAAGLMESATALIGSINSRGFSEGVTSHLTHLTHPTHTPGQWNPAGNDTHTHTATHTHTHTHTNPLFNDMQGA